MTGLSSLSPRYATEPGPIGFGLALPKGPEAKSWIWIPARRHTGMTERDRFLRFYNRLATAQLLLSNAQLPLLDAKRANSPQRELCCKFTSEHGSQFANSPPGGVPGRSFVAIISDLPQLLPLRLPGMGLSRDPGLGFSFWFIREAKFKNLWTPASQNALEIVRLLRSI